MNILFVHNYYSEFGGEDAVVNNMIELLDKEHEVQLFSKKSKDYSSGFAKLKVICPYFQKQISDELICKIREFKPDVIHFHNVFPVITPYIYKKVIQLGIPMVQTIHNMRFFCPNGLCYKRSGKICVNKAAFIKCVSQRCYRDRFCETALYYHYMNYIQKKVLPQFDGILVLSEFMRQYIVQRTMQKEKIFILPNFFHNDSSLMNINTKFDSYFLFLGRITKEKGVLSLVKAFEKLNFKLRIVGTGNQEDEIKQYIIKNNISNIEMLGFVKGEEKRLLLSQAKALIIPSEWYEQFGMVVIEAFSNGTPVIASKIGALPYIVNEGKNGFLFETGNVEKLIISVLKMQALDYTSFSDMVTNSYDTWKEFYTPAVFRQNLLQIYNQVIDEKKTVVQN